MPLRLKIAADRVRLALANGCGERLKLHLDGVEALHSTISGERESSPAPRLLIYGTDLGQLLDTLGVKNVVLMGINTNTCVLNTLFTAFNFDYRVVVLSDCVASMYGEDLHVLGLQNVARCLGWILTNEQFFEKIRAAAPAHALAK